jgi:hypothetical protein
MGTNRGIVILGMRMARRRTGAEQVSLIKRGEVKQDFVGIKGFMISSVEADLGVGWMCADAVVCVSRAKSKKTSIYESKKPSIWY